MTKTSLSFFFNTTAWTKKSIDAVALLHKENWVMDLSVLSSLRRP